MTQRIFSVGEINSTVGTLSPFRVALPEVRECSDDLVGTGFTWRRLVRAYGEHHLKPGKASSCQLLPDVRHEEDV